MRLADSYDINLIFSDLTDRVEFCRAYDTIEKEGVAYFKRINGRYQQTNWVHADIEVRRWWNIRRCKCCGHIV